VITLAVPADKLSIAHADWLYYELQGKKSSSAKLLVAYDECFPRAITGRISSLSQ
jgi:hypothetical protein